MAPGRGSRGREQRDVAGRAGSTCPARRRSARRPGTAHRAGAAAGWATRAGDRGVDVDVAQRAAHDRLDDLGPAVGDVELVRLDVQRRLDLVLGGVA